MRPGRLLVLALTAGCAAVPPPPPATPVYACGMRADECGARLLGGLADRTIPDPLPPAPDRLVNVVPVIDAVEDAYDNKVRTVGGSPVTETEYYSLYVRYQLAGGEQPLAIAAIAAVHRPLADALEAGRCWHWFMDHGGREDGRLVPAK